MEELALHFLADAALVEGDWAAAEEAYRVALRYATDRDFVGRATDEALGMAMAMAGAGRVAQASRIAWAVWAKQAEIGTGNDAWWTSMQERHLGGVSGDGAAAAAFETVIAELLDGAPMP